MKSSAALSSLNRIGNLRILTVSAATLLASYAGARGQAISVSGVSTYSQNFDTLPTIAGMNWTDNITIPG